MTNPTKPEEVIEGEVVSALSLQKDLETLQDELMADERFQRFLELSKTVPAKLEAAWKQIEQQMIEANVKSIKGDWGSITIAERLGWTVDLDQLPRKFVKRVADTKKLSDTYRLEGKAPAGAEPKYTKYLTKRIK